MPRLVLLLVACVATAAGLRIDIWQRLRGPEASSIDAGTDAISRRAQIQQFCKEKVCLAASKFWCNDQCVDSESECSEDARQARLNVLAARSKCAEENKVLCKVGDEKTATCHEKGQEQGKCPDFETAECDGLQTATGGTGATGATGPAATTPAPTTKGPTAAPTTTVAPTTTAAPSDGMTEDQKERESHRPDELTACDMVKPWETNQWYIKNVLPGPPKGKSFCCLALIKELLNRIDDLKKLLANCKPPGDPEETEECKKARAELKKLEGLLASQMEGANIKTKGELDKELSSIDKRDFTKAMTAPWDKNELYKKYVQSHESEIDREFSGSLVWPAAQERKALPPLGSSIGPDQYHQLTPENNKVAQLMQEYRKKHHSDGKSAEKKTDEKKTDEKKTDEKKAEPKL